MGEAVGVGAGFDDGAFEGEPVDDGGAESWVGEGFGPAGEGFVGGDGHGCFLFPFGEDLEEELGAAFVEFHVSEFVDAQQVHASVAGDGLGEGFVVLCLDEFVDEPGGEDVFDPEAFLGGGGAEPDEQVGLPGPGIADQAQGLAFADPVPGSEGVDGGGVDVRVRVEVEVPEPFIPGKSADLTRRTEDRRSRSSHSASRSSARKPW